MNDAQSAGTVCSSQPFAMDAQPWAKMNDAGTVCSSRPFLVNAQPWAYERIWVAFDPAGNDDGVRLSSSFLASAL